MKERQEQRELGSKQQGLESEERSWKRRSAPLQNMSEFLYQVLVSKGCRRPQVAEGAGTVRIVGPHALHQVCCRDYLA